MVARTPILALVAVIGCQSAEEVAPPMDATDVLVRTSLDLRGVRPGLADLDAVEADPAALEALVDDYLADPRFADRVRDLYAEIYLTRAEQYYVNAADYGVDGLTQVAMTAAVGEEPLQLLAEIARADLPYTQVVTADFTMANEVLAAIWPLDYAGPGWQRAVYTDGRPHAGILTTNSLHWRYPSTTSNANRKRANQVSRILLCNDYLVRPIEVDRNVNLLDQEAVDTAIRENPACVACHNSLDPLAAYFFGFQYRDQNAISDVSIYHPSREREWRTAAGAAPAYYGEPGYTLDDLGSQIASDPRFVQCAVEQGYELLLRRDASLADTNELVAHREAFLAGNLTLRSLYASLVRSPRYRAGVDEEGGVPKKMVTPDLLASEIAGLTGFSLTYAGYDMLRSDAVGYLTLAGGADGYFVTEHARSPNATLLLVQERLAEAAAWHVVGHDAEHRVDATLFVDVSPTSAPADHPDAARRQLARLHRVLFGRAVAADGPEIAANLELWDALFAVDGDPRAAWAGVLSALLRDPDLLFY